MLKSAPKSNYILVLLMTAAVLLVYSQASMFGFVDIDDDLYVFENTYVQNGLDFESIKWAFRFNDISYWHPVTWLSLMTDSHLFGMNPGAYHITNIVLHLLNGLLLFVILRGITGSTWRSGFVAALFTLHPINVESVVWVAERKNVLSTFFWMASLFTYVKYTHRPSAVKYLGALVFFTFGLLAKPTVSTLPFVFLLLDVWPLKRVRSLSNASPPEHRQTARLEYARPASIVRLITEKIPFFFLSASSVYIAFLSSKQHDIIVSLEAVPISLRIENAIATPMYYMGKILWPQNLAVFYPYPDHVPLWLSLPAAFWILAVSILSLFAIKKLPFFFTGWFWFLGTLVPVSGLIQGGSWPAMADRFSYVPAIGIFIIAAWGIPASLKSSVKNRKLFLAGAAIVLALCTTVSWFQVRHWKSSTALFQRAVNVTAGNDFAHHNLGYALFAEGKTLQSIQHYNEAIKINPEFDLAHANLGVVLASLGNFEKALFHYHKALQIKPNSAFTYSLIGNLEFRRGNTQKAIEAYNRSLHFEPDYAPAYNGLGAVFAMKGHRDDAAAMFEKALQIDPNFADAKANLSQIKSLRNTTQQDE